MSRLRSTSIFACSLSLVACHVSLSRTGTELALESPSGGYDAVIERGEDGSARLRVGVHRGRGLAVQTRSIHRGPSAVVAQARELVRADARRVELRFEGTDVSEALEAKPLGVEQSWRFGTRPAGEGDIVVQVDVDGAELAHADERGLVLRARDGSLHRYGHATWIDARGAETALPSRFDEDRVVVRVPDELVDRSAFPALLDPMIGPEMPVDDAFLVATPGQRDVQIIHDGTDFVVAYEDASLTWRGVRVREDGSRVDTTPFPLGFATFACEGGVCVGVGTSPGELTMRRFRSDGTPLDASAVVVVDHPANASVASYGTGFIIVWTPADGRANANVHYRHYRWDGTPVEDAPREIELASTQSQRAVACGPTNCLFLYMQLAGLMARRVAHDGTLLDTEELGIRLPFYYSRVLHDGLRFVAYDEAGQLSRITDEGMVLGPPIDLATTTRGAACNGARCFFGTRTAAGVPELAVLDHGATAPTRTALGTTATVAPRIACSATRCAAGWIRSNVLDLRLFDPTGAPTTPVFHLLATPSAQTGAALASDGTEYLAAWTEARGGNAQLYAARIDPVLGTRDPNAIAVTRTTSTSAHPAIGYGRGTYMVAFYVSAVVGAVAVARVSPTGAAPDATAPPSLGAATSPPSIAHDGTNFLVVWRDGSGRVVGRRVNPVGATIEGAPFIINTVGSDPQVAFDGTNHLVVWYETRSPRSFEIYGRRIARDGTLLDATSFPIGSAVGDQLYHRVAFGDGTYFVAWADGRHSGQWAVYGSRVTPAGDVLDLDGIEIYPVATGHLAPAIVGLAWDGAAFLVTRGSASDDQARVELRRVAPDGAVLDASPTPIAEARSVPPGPVNTIASRRPGEAMVGYTLFSEEHGVNRMRVRTYASGALGLPCTSGDDCDSLFCVSGVCCDTRCDGACEACSVAAGAAADGTCGPRAAGTVCRPSAGGMCDPAEVCDGTASTCPPDLPPPGCGGTDAGMPDAGPTPTPDAGPTPTPDAGPEPGPDAGPTPRSDGGAPPRPDAGTGAPDAGGSSGGGGCRASGAGGTTPLAVLGLALATLALRRRR